MVTSHRNRNSKKNLFIDIQKDKYILHEAKKVYTRPCCIYFYEDETVLILELNIYIIKK